VSIPQLPISLSQVKAEFAGLVSTPLSAYVRGGAFVPIQTLGGIPTAPPISLATFAGVSFPAAVSFVSASILQSEGWTITTQVVAPDLSTATFVVARTHVTNGAPNAQFFDINALLLNFHITGAIAPIVQVRLPATQPRDVAGYWQLWGNTSPQFVCSANLLPQNANTTFEHFWHQLDQNTTYQGELRYSTNLVPSNGAPPSATIDVDASKNFQLFVTWLWNMNIGTAAPPGVQMTWNTRNGANNNYVEFPVIIDVYDGGVLRASYPMLLHFEMNALETFNPS
jgi:hypothetical protein